MSNNECSKKASECSRKYIFLFWIFLISYIFVIGKCEILTGTIDSSINSINLKLIFCWKANRKVHKPLFSPFVINYHLRHADACNILRLLKQLSSLCGHNNCRTSKDAMNVQYWYNRYSFMPMGDFMHSFDDRFLLSPIPNAGSLYNSWMTYTHPLFLDTCPG